MIGKDKTAGENVRRLRLERVQMMLQRITDYNVLHKDGMLEDELLARFSLQIGVTRKKATEYLQDLIDAKYVRRDSSAFLWVAENKTEPDPILTPEEKAILNSANPAVPE